MKKLNAAPFPAQLHYARGELLNCLQGAYANGQHALLLTDANTGAPVAKATVALFPPEHRRLPSGAVALKDWSENKGVVETLLAAGIIQDPCILEIPVGTFGLSAKVYKLSKELA